MAWLGGNLLNRLSATDRLHGDSVLELGTVGGGLAYSWQIRFRGGATPQRLMMGIAQKNSLFQYG